MITVRDCSGTTPLRWDCAGWWLFCHLFIVRARACMLRFFNQELFVHLIEIIVAVNWCLVAFFVLFTQPHFLVKLFFFNTRFDLYRLLLALCLPLFLSSFNLLLSFFINCLLHKIHCLPHLLYLTFFLKVAFWQLLHCWSWLWCESV